MTKAISIFKKFIKVLYIWINFLFNIWELEGF